MNQSINQSIARSRRAKEARGNPRARRRATTATAPSRPRLAAVADAKPRRRETPDARTRASPRPTLARRRATSRTMRQRRCAAEIQSSSCTHASNRPIVRSFDRARVLVSGPSIPCARVVFVFVRTLRPLPCRPNMSSSSSVAVCARRIRGRRRDGRSRRVSRLARCVSMFN